MYNNHNDNDSNDNNNNNNNSSNNNSNSHSQNNNNSNRSNNNDSDNENNGNEFEIFLADLSTNIRIEIDNNEKLLEEEHHQNEKTQQEHYPMSKLLPEKEQPSQEQKLNQACLPPHWEERETENGRKYYLDHVNKTSTWVDPRTAPQQQQNTTAIHTPNTASTPYATDQITDESIMCIEPTVLSSDPKNPVETNKLNESKNGERPPTPIKRKLRSSTSPPEP